MTRDETAKALDTITTHLVLVVGALERLADDLRRAEEPQVPAAAPDRTEA